VDTVEDLAALAAAGRCRPASVMSR
jgi:hypothetical protein